MLDTETKGTGAHVVPLDPEQPHETPHETPSHKPIWVPPKRRPRAPKPPPPRLPRRFRVVDVVTRELLADDADVRTTLSVLGRVEHAHDVTVFVWEPEDARWRLLSLAEQQTVWQRRRSA